jgi:hypothetical protein
MAGPTPPSADWQQVLTDSVAENGSWVQGLADQAGYWENAQWSDAHLAVRYPVAPVLLREMLLAVPSCNCLQILGCARETTCSHLDCCRRTQPQPSRWPSLARGEWGLRGRSLTRRRRALECAFAASRPMRCWRSRCFTTQPSKFSTTGYCTITQKIRRECPRTSQYRNPSYRHGHTSTVLHHCCRR